MPAMNCSSASSARSSSVTRALLAVSQSMAVPSATAAATSRTVLLSATLQLFSEADERACRGHTGRVPRRLSCQLRDFLVRQADLDSRDDEVAFRFGQSRERRLVALVLLLANRGIER